MMNLSVYPHECEDACYFIHQMMEDLHLLIDDYGFYILKISMQRSQTQGLQTSIQK